MAETSTTTYLTPPELAKRWRVKPSKVTGWISRGEIFAINVATNPAGRPRWRIPPSAIVEFEMARATKLAVKPMRRRRDATVIEFFDNGK